MSGISPLEPLLPGGRAERVLVIGRRDTTLIPPASSPGDADVDLVLLLPDRRQLGNRSWLRSTAIEATEAIGEDGVVYALVPRRFRKRTRAELQRAGLVVEQSFAHLTSADAPRYLVPLEPRVWRYAFERLISARPRTRAVLQALMALPAGRQFVAGGLPALGVAARRPGARPLADWIFRLAGETRAPGGAIVGTSWRGPSGSVTVHCFATGEATPWGVAKVGLGDGDERSALERLGPAAERAGARVPAALGHTALDGRSALVQTHVDGRPAASLLASSPHQLHRLLVMLADWLACWNQATASRAALDRALLDEHVLGPAASLSAVLPLGDEYRTWLRSRCDALIGSQVPLVAVHNDLTMWNVVLDRNGSLGVLDWETAQERALPLVDFFYASADAVAASERNRSRLRAFESCFAHDGSRAVFLSRLQTQVATAVGVEPPVVELAFHACWLQHARNERAGAGARETQFAEIVQWLALNTDRVLR